MSLFKLKNIWNASFPQQQFDERHMVFGLVNKIPSIALGSYKGNFRVYSFEANNNNRPFRQIFQKSFNQPIIDVKFVSHPDQSVRGNTLGILLFRKFIYITLESSPESPIFGAKILNVEVEPSFAIIPYPISLTTLNSSIQTLNPKQIHNLKQSDPIYPFTVSREDFYYMDGQDLVKLKGTIQQWRIIVGRVRTLFLIRDQLIIIGQLNLWQVNQGKIIKCKKLQEEVSCAAIAHKKNQQFNIIICNFLMQMLVYTQDYSLLWAVKLDYVPIKIIISQHELLKGAMIFLTDQSSIEVTYAGAEVQQRILKPLEQSVNLERVQKQTQYFIQKMKQLKTNPNAKLNNVKKTDENSANANLQVKLTFSQPQQTTEYVDNSQFLYKSLKSNKLIKCVLNVQLLAQSTQLQKVVITITKPTNIFVKTEQIQLQKIKGKQFAKFDCFISKQKFPYQTKVKISIRYQKGNSTKIIEKQIQIPMSFQCQVSSFESMQNIDKKITFKCTQNPLPTFNQLFPDILQRGCGQQKKAITFTLVNGVKTSIVYNKNLSKAKIQSQVYSGLCLIFMQFMRRIQNYHQKNKIKLPPVEIEISLKQLEQQIRDYHSYRDQLKNQYKDLLQKTQEFKKTQKKLLLKMKQKNSNIQHINRLLEFNYSRVLEATQKYENLQEQTHIVNHNFQIGLKFIMEMVYRRSSATQKARQKAENLIKFDSQNQDILDEEGWAERLTKNIAFYLNKKYDPTVQNLQKLVTWIITKVNNGDWNN